MDTIEEIDGGLADEWSADASICVQPSCYLLELSLDWIVLRASENIHHLLRESHVTLIDEPLGRFVHSQALHDLRNLFSRLSGTTGVGRAYAVRLTDDHDLVDVAFQLSDGRVLLEVVPSAGCFGECFGSVGGLIAGLSGAQGQALLDAATRRMRALTGYDRVTLTCGDGRSESSRGAFTAISDSTDLPVLIADSGAEGINLFPREVQETSAHAALMRSPAADERKRLSRQVIRSMLRVPFKFGEIECEFCCESRTPRHPSFELHAAAELFAQMFALCLEAEKATNH